MHPLTLKMTKKRPGEREKRPDKTYRLPHGIEIAVNASEIGIGKQGIVWPGTFEGKEIAIKDIDGLNCGRGALKAYRELEIFKRIRHDNIVRYITSFGCQHAHKLQYFCIAMEKCDATLNGGDFASLYCGLIPKVKNSYRFPDSFRSIAFQLLCAVKYLHACGLMHRDIKPGNIGVINSPIDGQPPLVKLLDFGLSRKQLQAQAGLTADTSIAECRSIELMIGSDAYDNKVDMWSVGCVLYRLATNEFPFDYRKKKVYNLAEANALIHEILPKITSTVHEEYDATDVPDDARVLIARMLVKDPAQRASAAEALNDPYFGDLMANPMNMERANQPPPVDAEFGIIDAQDRDPPRDELKAAIVDLLEHKLDF